MPVRAIIECSPVEELAGVNHGFVANRTLPSQSCARWRATNFSTLIGLSAQPLDEVLSLPPNGSIPFPVLWSAPASASWRGIFDEYCRSDNSLPPQCNWGSVRSPRTICQWHTTSGFPALWQRDSGVYEVYPHSCGVWRVAYWVGTGLGSQCAWLVSRGRGASEGGE